MKSERKVAVITGASRGIGAALLGAYRDIGYHVIANSRSIDKSHDPSISAVDGDIASAETADRIVELAIERYGRIDTLINNAGLFIAKPFTEYSEADFATMVGVNLAGFFHLTQRAAATMLLAGSGHIVNITATIAEQPMASLAAALAALTKGGLNVSPARSRSNTQSGTSASTPSRRVRSQLRCMRLRRTTSSQACSRWDAWARRRRSSMP
jgi:NAD(P)-dependent dehydrogenase (short-subunit alcohol dehydrogenase family)